MPIYEYECKACSKVQEVMQKMDAPAPVECEACHQGPLVKLMSRTAFVLKGAGWYVTDFRGGSNPKKADGAANGDASPAAGESAAKPASSDAPAAATGTPPAASPTPTPAKSPA